VGDSILSSTLAKEKRMRKIVSVTGLVTMLCLATGSSFAKTPQTPRSAPAQIVIVFKDGHRQTFNLSEVARVEFPSTVESSSDTGSSSFAPSRGHFLGKWEVGDGAGNNFFITLHDDGDAMRSMGDVHGKWVYVDGEARVTWDDGAQDAIRKAGTGYKKYAYESGKSFTDMPANVTGARNTTPRPI
jgi:hypothetical protein